tara:strand:+ start:2313 stop:2570 length:258 start_codon:yes stop_codon:yes gene_type:complete
MNEININKNLFTTEINDTLIILNTDTGSYLELNSSAKFIWEKIEQEKNYQNVLKAITEEYELSETEAKNSLDKFLLKASEKNLLN